MKTVFSKKSNNEKDKSVNRKVIKKIQRKLIVLTLIFSVLTGLAGCGVKSSKDGESKKDNQVETVEIKHSNGTTKVQCDPQKIVVLDWAVLDIIDSLGLGDKVVGIPKSGNTLSYLKQYAENTSIKNTGTVKEADMEAIYALEPDVIFISGRMADSYEDLSKIAPTVLISISYEMNYMDSLKENVTQIASIWNKTEQVDELFNDFDKRTKVLTDLLKDHSGVISMVSNSSITVLGTEGRCSLINSLGIDNISDTTSTHGESVSFEYLLKENPEYIFVLDRDSAIGNENSDAAKDIIENDLVKKTDAYKNGNIVYLSPTAWYLAEGGIESTNIMLQDLENIIAK